MKVLFISRAYPPVVGGIEKQNYEIFHSLSRLAKIKLVANRRGKLFLPVFIVRSIYGLLRHRKWYDVVLLGDGVLAVLAFLIKMFSNKPVVCIVHGLDITYRNWLYQKLWINYFFKMVDKFIAVGNETISQGVLAGVDRQKFEFVPNGVSAENPAEEYSKADLAHLLGSEPGGPVLLTLGRLVKRKGVAWFVEEVVPDLHPSITYLIAGYGEEQTKILGLIKKYRLEGRVKFLGKVSDMDKEILFGAADLFIQPNIPVENDMEGFGLVVLEAGQHATFVVASELEGLKDAICQEKNGVLLPPGNKEEYKHQIEKLLADSGELKKKSKAAQKFVLSNFTWDSVAKGYLSVLQDQCRSSNKTTNEK